MAKSLILKDLSDKLGIKISTLESEIGVSNGAISKSINKNGEITPLIKEKVSQKYQNINKNWLETGKGEIFTNAEHPEKPVKKIPMIGEAAAGGDMQMAYSDTANDVQYIDVGDLLRDSEAAFTVYGNSMTPNYPSGCVLGVKRNYDGFIQPGETYLLETKSNRVFKRLYLTKDKKAYKCKSDNEMQYDSGEMQGEYYYPMFEIPLSDVIRLYDVTGMIRRNRNSGLIQRQK